MTYALYCRRATASAAARAKCIVVQLNLFRASNNSRQTRNQEERLLAQELDNLGNKTID